MHKNSPTKESISQIYIYFLTDVFCHLNIWSNIRHNKNKNTNPYFISVLTRKLIYLTNKTTLNILFFMLIPIKLSKPIVQSFTLLSYLRIGASSFFYRLQHFTSHSKTGVKIYWMRSFSQKRYNYRQIANLLTFYSPKIITPAVRNLTEIVIALVMSIQFYRNHCSSLICL